MGKIGEDCINQIILRAFLQITAARIFEMTISSNYFMVYFS